MNQVLCRSLSCVFLFAVASCKEGGEAPAQKVESVPAQRDFEWSAAQWIIADNSEKARVVSFWSDHAADMIEQRGAATVADEAMPQLTDEVVACVDRLVTLLPEQSRSTLVDVIGEDCAGYVANERTRLEFDRLRSSGN